MNIYRLNEYEYWAANTPQEALLAAMDATGCSRDEIVDDRFTGTPIDLTIKVYADEEMTRKITAKTCLDEMSGPGFAFGSDY